jgi:hypothetical protein
MGYKMGFQGKKKLCLDFPAIIMVVKIWTDRRHTLGHRPPARLFFKAFLFFFFLGAK